MSKRHETLISYILLTYDGETLYAAKAFYSDIKNLDTDPYQNDNPFVIGSNQCVVREENATTQQKEMAEKNTAFPLHFP